MKTSPGFEGFRDLATNGVDKPVLNVFRMFGMMQGNRVDVNTDLAYDFSRIKNESVRGERDINALAAKEGQSATVMVWNYHDDNITGPDAPVDLTLKGIPAQRVFVQHYRIDQQFSNSYEAWKKMGSPKAPTAEQMAELEDAGQLQLLTSPAWVTVKNGAIDMPFLLPGQGVSLVKLSW